MAIFIVFLPTMQNIKTYYNKQLMPFSSKRLVILVIVSGEKLLYCKSIFFNLGSVYISGGRLSKSLLLSSKYSKLIN